VKLPKIKSEVINGNSNRGANPSTTNSPKKNTLSHSEILKELLKLHYEKRMSLLLWGKSGFGKSAVIKEFAKDMGMKLVDKKAISLDPLIVALPSEQKDRMTFKLADWFHELCNSDEPICFFLDEVNKFNNPSVQNMLNDIILDRQYTGHKIKDNVFIVAAANFVGDSEEATPLDDSIMKRFTHVPMIPTSQGIIEGMQTDIGRMLARDLKVTAGGKELYQEEILDRLSKDVPRQLDHIGILAEGCEERQIVEAVAKGRIGDAATPSVVDKILRHSLFVSELTDKNKDKVISMYNSGARVEVQDLLNKCDDGELVCQVVLETKSKVLMGVALKKLGNNHVMKDGTVFLVACADCGITFGGQ